MRPQTAVIDLAYGSVDNWRTRGDRILIFCFRLNFVMKIKVST